MNYKYDEDILKAIIIMKIIYDLYIYCKGNIQLPSKTKKKTSKKKDKGYTTKNKKKQKDSFKNEEITYNKVIPKHTVEYNYKYQSKIAYIPIIIAEKSISIPFEREIDFSERITEIVSTKGDIYLTKYNFIPLGIAENNTLKGNLFLKGDLINTIQYNSFESVNNRSYKGYMKTLKVFFPFEISTLLDCYRPPEAYCEDQNKININCSIKEVNIFTKDTVLKNNTAKNNNNISTFNSVNRKIIVNLIITITQIYPVKIDNNFILEKPSSN